MSPFILSTHFLSFVMSALQPLGECVLITVRSKIDGWGGGVGCLITTIVPHF